MFNTALKSFQLDWSKYLTRNIYVCFSLGIDLCLHQAFFCLFAFWNIRTLIWKSHPIPDFVNRPPRYSFELMSEQKRKVNGGAPLSGGRLTGPDCIEILTNNWTSFSNSLPSGIWQLLKKNYDKIRKLSKGQQPTWGNLYFRFSVWLDVYDRIGSRN